MAVEFDGSWDDTDCNRKLMPLCKYSFGKYTVIPLGVKGEPVKCGGGITLFTTSQSPYTRSGGHTPEKGGTALSCRQDPFSCLSRLSLDSQFQHD